MATLNELGRNSASITYGPGSAGNEMWPTLALLDQWIRNDTLQGTATASGTLVTGVGSVYGTQVRAGDVIMIAGQMRTVVAVNSDTAFTVNSAFSPEISLANAIKVINTTLTGTVTTNVRGSTRGTVNVTNGSATVTGTGTFFLSEFTNSVTVSSVVGTVELDNSGNIIGSGTQFQTGSTVDNLQPGDSIEINGNYFTINTVTSNTAATVTLTSTTPIAAGETLNRAARGISGRTVIINGRVRQITNIASNTTMTINFPLDFTDSNIKVKSYPRGTIAVTAGSANVTGTGTNFSWDLVSGDQVWIDDELRTFNFDTNSTTSATLSDYIGYAGLAINVLRQAVTGMPFHRDDTYINGSGTLFTTELRVGDDIIIDGTEATVTQILSASEFRINLDFTHNVFESIIYKKKKIHGYILEGTREGAAVGGKFTTATTSLAAAGSVYPLGTNTIVVASATGLSPNGIIKIQGAGGPALVLTGTVTSSGTAVTGTNTLFTSQLHVGAEIVVAGQYLTVATIVSDTSLTTIQSSTNASATPIYRSVPLYTFISGVAGTTITLGTTLKNTVYSTGVNAPAVYTPSAATDYIEYVYSAPNKSAEASITLFNNSLDRKYFGFRFYPLSQGGGTGTTLALAGSAYNLTVYERWTASHSQTNGVGINIADCSDRTTALSGVTDLTSMTQTSGGFLYLFAKPRYFIIQGKTFSNAIQPWLGCVEFERAQPEDTGTGLGTSAGVSITTGAPVSGTPAVSPWPCFAYVHGNRFPVGATQNPTLPISHSNVHGCVLSVPRIRLSTGDLVGLNSHVYSAMTITTGRWGHLFELGAGGSYTAPTTGITAGAATLTANTIPQPHMGHLVPVFTNVYNSKRFMFSPVVVLGTAYDPDIRGRLYGIKVIPSALGTLMDTVSVTTDSNDFYDAAQPANDHWVLTAAVQTFRFALAATNFQSTRSLEDVATQAANTSTTFQNSFRWAIPA
jgi:sorbitol-specific phosphotransferase system component IIA